jgi:16S rRNA (guanine527-N7)-methyltransferase
MAEDADVSRETPSPHPSVERVFGSRASLAIRYAGLLASEGVVRGLIGPREAPRLWERHLLNCAVVTDLLPEGADVCDLGTGAGLPGLVLAIRRPDLRVTLVEPLLRRTTFLEEVATELGLGQVTVVRGRAEDLHGRSAFSAVTSRALAPLPRLLDWSMPLVSAGGALLAMKGASVYDEIEGAQEQLRRHQAGLVEVLTVGSDEIDPPTTVLRVESTQSPPLGLGAMPSVSSKDGRASPRSPRRRRRK